MPIIYKLLFGISLSIFIITGIMSYNPELTHIAITHDEALVIFPMSGAFILMVGLDYLLNYKL